MKLLVRVIEAKNIPAMDPNGFSDPYVKLQLGKQKFKTKVVKKCLNPSWCEEFSFRVDDLKEKLVISVLDEDKYFNDDFVGQIKVPVSQVFEATDKFLGTAWYVLKPKNKKDKIKECGEILLTICLSQNNMPSEMQPAGDNMPFLGKQTDVGGESPLRFANSPSRIPSPMRSEDNVASREEKTKFSTRIAQIFNKSGDKDKLTSASSSKSCDVSELVENTNPVGQETKVEEQVSSENFDELLKSLETREQVVQMPNNLPGGVVLDQLYGIGPREMNSFIFSSDSDFFKSLADVQSSTEMQIGLWKFDGSGESLRRVVTYVKCASKLIKALKATEDHTYLCADGKNYAVLSVVSTPDAPYGGTFRTEVLYCITAGPDLPSGEQSSRLVVSWRMNFLQSTMMKGMIESGARQGIKENFEQFANLISQKVKPVDGNSLGSEKEQALASLQAEKETDWKLAVRYFANFTVVSTFLLGLYVVVHIWLSSPSTIQGLEFVGLSNFREAYF